MHPKAMSPWLWTCGVWAKGRHGLMGRASGDTGWPTPRETASNAATQEHSGPRNASLVVGNPLKDGIIVLQSLLIA